MDFQNIVGNEKTKEFLKNSIKTGNISHSYLFIGNEGIGKSKIAKQFAKEVLCISDDKPCDNCKSCIEFDSQNNPDFKIIEPDGKSIKIEQIREITDKIAEKPVTSNKKVYIIDNADLMTKEAQNGLLKTLEEPPEYAVLILIVSNISKILNTIRLKMFKSNFRKNY